MAHPKRRQSKTRRDKRRTHQKSVTPTLSVDPTSGEVHRRHHAHWQEGKLYYRGRVVVDNTQEESEA